MTQIIPGFEDMQKLITGGNSLEVLRILHRHYLPSDDFLTTLIHADALNSITLPEAALPLYRKLALLGGQHAVTLWQRVQEMQCKIGDIDDAILSLKKALSLDRGNLDLHQYAAQLLFNSTLHFQASCHARHILENSTDDDMLAVAENIYRFSMQPYEAYQVVKKRQECSAEPNLYLGLVLCGAQGICEWDTVTQCARILDNKYRQGDYFSVREIPLYNIARIANEEINWNVARATTSNLEDARPAFDQQAWETPQRIDDKIRVGLLSADFSSHPVIQLIIGLFETIDKSKFELFAFDDGKNDSSSEQRMLNAMDSHIDVREQSDMVVAQKVYDEKIDILIDLMGLTTKNRQGVLALRPCPVTAVFLGFPGTCGMSKIDYIITDATVTPDTSKPFYSEKLCRLPEVFMPNDNKRPIADNPVTRADLGLPDDVVVFGSFNRSFKLDENSVNLWMRILARVPGSVLWQKGEEAHMKRVFLETAARHGVPPERIIFAGNTSSVALHLSRAGLVDLGLDTLIYNGHTITADLLWAGTPVITCVGAHFASRVSSSLLKAVGLEECITHSVKEMEDLAVALALNPARRQALREKLLFNKQYMPLFDTERYTRHFETALVMMLERSRQGLPPDHIDVPALPSRCLRESADEAVFFIKDGPPRIFEEQAGTPDGGAYADMAENQIFQKTPYAIHYGNCPLCESRAQGTGIPVSIQSSPLWREPLPKSVFWVTCPQCNHMHVNSFWDDAGLAMFRARLPKPDASREHLLAARLNLAPAIEYMWKRSRDICNKSERNHWFVADAEDSDIALAASSFGFYPAALTPSSFVYEQLTSLGIPVWLESFALTDIDGQALVLSLPSLEQQPYPRLYLARARALVQQGGFLHIPFVELRSFAWHTEGTDADNAFFKDPLRMHLFSQQQMASLLEEEGFSMEQIFSDPSSVSGLHVIASKRRNY